MMAGWERRVKRGMGKGCLFSIFGSLIHGHYSRAERGFINSFCLGLYDLTLFVKFSGYGYIRSTP